MEKKCFKCGAVKPLTEFYRHPQMADGHLNKCKACARKDVSQNYDAKREQYAEYERQRKQSEARKANKLEYQRRSRARNPEKWAARTAVRNAVRDGRLVRLPCEACGATENVQAHHEDYSKPLDVRWLCFKHHREIAHGQKVNW